MGRTLLLTPILLFLAGCGEDEAVIAADYEKIVQATCFLSGFGRGEPKHDECVRIVRESTAAIRRRSEAAESAARTFEAQMAFAESVGESIRDSRRSSCH